MSDLHTAPSIVVGVDGSKAATNAALWTVDEAVNRDIPLRLVYVIDRMDSSDAGEHSGRLAAARAALHDAYRAVDATGQPVKVESEILRGKPLTKLMDLPS
jgi:nucleotide-binding universal stress UspA family protein